MISVDVAFFLLLYIGGGCTLILGLAIYYDRRDKVRHEEERHRVVYHCIKCGHIYVGKFGSTECKCPKCGFVNGRLSF